MVGGCILSIHKKIYNRWGELIFESNQIGEAWNGRTSSGNQATEGTYFYIFQVGMYKNGEKVNNTFKGTVTLLRDRKSVV